MRARLITGFVGTSATLAAVITATAPSASADLVTQCKGQGGAVTVPGDLVVPKGASCELNGTRVEGNVRVAADADLVAKGVVIRGNVTVGQGGYVDTFNTSIRGTLVNNAGYGSYLQNTWVGGNVTSRGTQAAPAGGFLYIFKGQFSSSLRVNTGELYVEDSEIDGDVGSTKTDYTDIYTSWVDGALSVKSNTEGSVLCATSVAKAATWADNAGTVQLGDGPASSCTGDNSIGAKASITNNNGESFVNGNIINGALALSGNNPLTKVSPDNRIRGGISGEHEAWDGGSATAMRKATADRNAEMKAKAEARTAAAEKKAVGKAF